jgi:hypothetical protein
MLYMFTNLVALTKILSLIDILARKKVKSGLNFGEAKNRSKHSLTMYKFIAMVGENRRLVHYQPMDFPSWPVQISNHRMAI